jgi:hypothetical protein
VKPPARALAGNLIWSTDGGVWVLWRVHPFPYGYATAADRLAVHTRLRGLLIALPANSMLLSICEHIDAWDVVADMIDGVDLGDRAAWAAVSQATATELGRRDLYRRRYYLAAELAGIGHGRVGGWWAALRDAAADLTARLGMPPIGVDDEDLAARRQQARALEASLGVHCRLERVSVGEARWLYARALRRGGRDPALDAAWEPGPAQSARGGGVLAALCDAVVKEGGYRDDPGRPRHRRYVRIDAGDDVSYQTYLAIADMPREFVFPGGAGEWLFHLDRLAAPIDWCVRIRSVPNAEAQAKLRRQQRQLIGQVDEYDGEVTGTPPSLADAITAVDEQRASLAANPTEPELQATFVLSLAASDLATLEDQAAAVTALFEPHEYGIFRPTGGQAALLRSMLPGTTPAPVCRDYTQFLLPADLAAGAPFCATTVGDPRGSLLGFTVGAGTPSPVLFDPGYGPTVGRTASLAAVGTLGSGKSFLLKRLCWDTIARGGQIVTVDRTAIGEYARFATVVPGRTQIIRLAPNTQVCLDPLRTFAGDERVHVTLGFLSLLAGCSTQSEEGAALADAVHAVAHRPQARLADVVDELQRLAVTSQPPDLAARSLARRLDHFRRVGIGRIAFGDGAPVDLGADLTVFWAPHLALPDREALRHEHLAPRILPEEILGQALVYLVAAVGRRIVFSNPGRFGAALYDEAWVLLASPHGQRLVLEGIRDGRKHNGAIWLASQHPADLVAGELVDLLGPRFVFHQAPGAIAAATRFLGVPGSDDAAETLRHGLPTGRCLYRDVRDQVALIDIAPPVIASIRAAADTTPPEPDSLRGVVSAYRRPTELHTAHERRSTTPTGPTQRPTLTPAAVPPDAAPSRRRRRTPLAAGLAEQAKRP